MLMLKELSAKIVPWVVGKFNKMVIAMGLDCLAYLDDFNRLLGCKPPIGKAPAQHKLLGVVHPTR